MSCVPLSPCIPNGGICGAFHLRRCRGSIDVGGALAATAGLALTVFGIARAPEEGWASAATLGVIAGGVALLAAFVAIQAARREPLVCLRILRTPNLAAANLAQVLLGAACGTGRRRALPPGRGGRGSRPRTGEG